MAGANTKTFTDANFQQEVIEAAGPVLVDFWAEWCMPCKALGPTIDELANENAGKVKVGKVDTDANPSLATQFSISAIPTVILFKDGEIKERFVGLRSKRDLQASLEACLKG
jgi:thioredoxin 1